MKKNCPKNLSSNLGFTLIELLLVLSLITLIFSLGIAQYNRFNRSQNLVKAKDELISNLRLAQSKAMVAEKPGSCVETLSGHKLKFIDNQSYKIVAVCGEEIDVKTDIVLPVGITKQAGPDEIFFKVLSQGVESEVTIILMSDFFSETKTITISAVGEIK